MLIISNEQTKDILDHLLEGAMEQKIYWLPTQVISLEKKIEYHKNKVNSFDLDQKVRAELSEKLSERLILERLNQLQNELNYLKLGESEIIPNYITYINLNVKAQKSLWHSYSGLPSSKYFLVATAIFKELENPKLRFEVGFNDKSLRSVNNRYIQKHLDSNPLWVSLYSLINKEQLVFNNEELRQRIYVINI